MTDLFLSRARLELQVHRGFSAAYVVHQLVADMAGERDDRGYLYRVTAKEPRGASVLVLADRKPPAAFEARPWGRIRSIETRAFDVPFASDQVLDFEIRLNATRVVTQPSGKKKRVDLWDAVFAADRGTDLTPHDVYRQYLTRAMGTGADVLDCRVVERGEVVASRAGRAPVRFVATNVIGALRVREPGEFRRLLFSGVGRSRSFGCGLLCLSRPGTVLTRRYGLAAAAI